MCATYDGTRPGCVPLCNKCIGDDTKAAARQSLNCIKNKKIEYGKNDFHYGGCNSYTLQCGSGIVTVNSPSGSTLQCDTWLWDDMPLNSPKTSAILEFYIWFPFRPHHRSRHVIPHPSPKFYPNRTTPEKMRKARFLHFGVKIQNGRSPSSWILGVQ